MAICPMDRIHEVVVCVLDLCLYTVQSVAKESMSQFTVK